MPSSGLKARRAVVEVAALRGASRADRAAFWAQRRAQSEGAPLPALEEPRAPPSDPGQGLGLGLAGEVEASDEAEYRKQNENLLKLIGNRPPKQPPSGPVFENPVSPMDPKVVRLEQEEKARAARALPKLVTVRGEVRPVPMLPGNVVLTAHSGGLLPGAHPPLSR